MTNLGKEFKKLGYLVVPNFINQEQVKALRKVSEVLLDRENESTLKPTTFLKNSLFTNIIFSVDFKNVINQLSSEYRYFLPNFTIRRNLYIGWHTDDEFVEADEAETPGVLQCNIYLQSNALQTGGGIDVAPGTHQLSQREKKSLIGNENSFFYNTVETNPGDLLIFDYRAIHRSSIAAENSRMDARLALQWTVCKSPDKASMFMQYLIRRQQEKLHLSDFTDKRALGYFFDAVNVIYPDSFDVETQNAITGSNIVVPSFSEMGEIQ